MIYIPIPLATLEFFLFFHGIKCFLHPEKNTFMYVSLRFHQMLAIFLLKNTCAYKLDQFRFGKHKASRASLIFDTFINLCIVLVILQQEDWTFSFDLIFSTNWDSENLEEKETTQVWGGEIHANKLFWNCYGTNQIKSESSRSKMLKHDNEI